MGHCRGGILLVFSSEIKTDIRILFEQATIGPVGVALGSEVSSLPLRATVQGVMGVCQTTIGWVISFVIPYIINPDAGNLGAKISYIFFGMSLILSIILFLYTPETKGLSYEEVFPSCNWVDVSWTTCSRQRPIPGSFSRSLRFIVLNIRRVRKQFRRQFPRTRRRWERNLNTRYSEALLARFRIALNYDTVVTIIV